MIVVIDSNLFLSALISPHGAPARVMEAWEEGRFRVVTCKEQIDELRRASRYPKLRSILKPHLVGKMLNTLQRADVYETFKRKHTAEDPYDAYLLDLAEAAGAQYLLTGDKRSGLLARRKVGTAKIMMATSFMRTVLKD
jgi:putative PIN family toxin of toxin-antitoxin system